MEQKITIGICTGGSIRAETVTSLVSNMINVAQTGIMANLLVQVGGYVDVNRNKIVEEARKAGTTHLMFIDADMIFPEDGIMRLLAHKKDIVGANYNVRLDPTSVVLSGPTVKMFDKKTNKVVSMSGQDFPTELFKCYSLATGFMMIDMKVFDKLEFPYFDAYQDKNGVHYTEDVDFCRKANESGAEVWCDPTIRMGHIGSYTY